VALVRTDVSEERIASIIRVTRIREVGTTLAVISNQRPLGENAMRSVLCTIVFLHSMVRLLVTADVPSSGILVTLMMEAIGSSETSVLKESHTASHPRRRHSS
jgi:hypothetical protein